MKKALIKLTIRFVKFLSNKYLILLAGILFVISASLDPLNHGFSEHDHDVAEIECQFCENEVFDTNDLNSKLAKVSFTKLFKIEIKQEFISFSPKNFHSRAPPRN